MSNAYPQRLEGFRHTNERDGYYYQYRDGIQWDARPLSPWIIEQRATAGATTSGTTETDCTGATITVTIPYTGQALVFGTFDLVGDTLADIFSGLLDVDGSNQGGQAIYQVAVADGDRKTIPQHWVVSLTPGSHTLKLQVVRASGTGTCTAAGTHTKLTVWLFGPDYVTNDASS